MKSYEQNILKTIWARALKLDEHIGDDEWITDQFWGKKSDQRGMPLSKFDILYGQAYSWEHSVLWTYF